MGLCDPARPRGQDLVAVAQARQSDAWEASAREQAVRAVAASSVAVACQA
jgi:hypothetical protein